MLDPQTWIVIKDGGATAALFVIFTLLARNYIKNMAKTAEEVASSKAQHIQVLTKVTDALTSLTIQVARNTDAIVKCRGKEDDEHERPRNHSVKCQSTED